MAPRSHSEPRIRVRVAVLAVLVATAGCTTFSGNPTPRPDSGYVSAEPIESVPANETAVNYSSDAVGDYAKLETALERAVAQNNSVHVPLTGDEIRQARAALDGVPRGSDPYYYVRYDGTVVAVAIAVAA